MRNVILFLILDGLLVAGATANQFYQGWANRNALNPVIESCDERPVEICDESISYQPKIVECTDSMTPVYPNGLFETGWAKCSDNQLMKINYFDNPQAGHPYMVIRCFCKEDL